MRFSSKAIGALRALATLKPPPFPGASWYNITTRLRPVVSAAPPDTEPDGDELMVADVSIMDEIGIWGVSARDFIHDINKLDVSLINLTLHSPGGDYSDGLAIYNALKRHQAQVHVTVLGQAASAASYIAMAGDWIEMPEHSEMMIHDAWSCAFGNASEMHANAQRLDEVSNMIASVYAANAGGEIEDWRALMRQEKWFTAKEAKEANLIDAVVADGSARAKELAEEQEAASAKVASVVDGLPQGALAVSYELFKEMAFDLGYTLDPESMTLTPVSKSDTVVNSKADEPADEAMPKVQANADDSQRFQMQANSYIYMYEDTEGDSENE